MAGEGASEGAQPFPAAAIEPEIRASALSQTLPLILTVILKSAMAPFAIFIPSSPKFSHILMPLLARGLPTYRHLRANFTYDVIPIALFQAPIYVTSGNEALV